MPSGHRAGTPHGAPGQFRRSSLCHRSVAGTDPHHVPATGVKIGRSRPTATIFLILWWAGRPTTTSSASRAGASVCAGSGLPVPRRRTLTQRPIRLWRIGARLPFVRSEETSLPPSWLRSVSYAGSVARATPHGQSDSQPVIQIASLKLRSQVSWRLASWRVRALVHSMAAVRVRRPSMRSIASV